MLRRVMTDPRPPSPFVRHRLTFLAVLGALLYLPFLHLRDMWYPDELDIAEVCRAMFLSGDWIAPRRMGTIWVDYPPMIYWTATATAHLFGKASEVALRLPNAIAALVTVLITCRVGSRWFDARSGLWAGFALLTFHQFAYQAVCYRPDVLFTLFIAAGLLTYAAGAGERPRVWLRVAGFALLGLAMLSKGPLGLLLPGLVLTLWHGTRKEWRRILELAPLALVSLAIYMAWFAACARAMGADNILYELYAQNFERFYRGDRGHEQAVYYYLANIWIDLFPWSLLLPFALVWTYRSGRWRDRHVQLLLWWFIAFFVFLSAAVTKRQLYLLPAYPAVALLLGPWLARAGSADEAVPAGPVRFHAVAFSAIVGILAASLLVLAGAARTVAGRLQLNETETALALALRWPLAITGVALLAGVLWIARAGRRGSSRAVLVRTGVVSVVFYVLLLALVLPPFDLTKTYKPQSEWIRERIGSETVFAMVSPHAVKKRGAFGYYTGAMVEMLRTPEEVEGFLERHPRSIVLIQQEEAGEFFAHDEYGLRNRVERELRAGNQLYLVVGKGS